MTGARNSRMVVQTEMGMQDSRCPWITEATVGCRLTAGAGNAEKSPGVDASEKWHFKHDFRLVVGE